jgi:hypothetical protein
MFASTKIGSSSFAQPVRTAATCIFFTKRPSRSRSSRREPSSETNILKRSGKIFSKSAKKGSNRAASLKCGITRNEHFDILGFECDAVKILKTWADF